MGQLCQQNGQKGKDATCLWGAFGHSFLLPSCHFVRVAFMCLITPIFPFRHTARFLFTWLTLLPFALYGTCGVWTTPVVAGIAAVLCGIEEIGVQVEEPFGWVTAMDICWTTLFIRRPCVLSSMHACVRNNMHTPPPSSIINCFVHSQHPAPGSDLQSRKCGCHVDPQGRRKHQEADSETTTTPSSR